MVQKSEKSADSLEFWRPQAVKVRRVSRFGAFHKIGDPKSKDIIAFWLAFAVWKFQKMQQSRVPVRFCCLEVAKKQQSRVPGGFCCLEVSKNATGSCSRSFLLS